jgi:ribosome maturation factor RimP
MCPVYPGPRPTRPTLNPLTACLCTRCVLLPFARSGVSLQTCGVPRGGRPLEVGEAPPLFYWPGVAGVADESLERELEAKVAELGFEFVELERVGSRSRPILRLRIDVAGGGPEPGTGVTLDDCATVSRALEPFLDAHPDLADNYVLEVSSPGIERPLVRESDWGRFAGREVALKGHGPLAGRGRRLEGENLGLAAGDGEERRVRLRLEDGAEVEIPLRDIARAHLVYRWDSGD